MPSPFPGMDSFIEACGLWGDFHDNLIAELERNLAARSPRDIAQEFVNGRTSNGLTLASRCGVRPRSNRTLPSSVTGKAVFVNRLPWRRSTPNRKRSSCML